MNQGPDQILRWGWRRRIHADHLGRAVQAWREAIAEGSRFAVELRDERGAVLQCKGTISNMDDRKRAERELQAPGSIRAHFKT